jgi:hypothetical protein
MVIYRNICNHLVVSVCRDDFVEWKVTVIVPPLWYAPWTWSEKTTMKFVGRGENWACVEINDVPMELNVKIARKHVAALNAIVSDYATDWVPRGNNLRQRA